MSQKPNDFSQGYVTQQDNESSQPQLSQNQGFSQRHLPGQPKSENVSNNFVSQQVVGNETTHGFVSQNMPGSTSHGFVSQPGNISLSHASQNTGSHLTYMSQQVPSSDNHHLFMSQPTPGSDNHLAYVSQKSTGSEVSLSYVFPNMSSGANVILKSPSGIMSKVESAATTSSVSNHYLIHFYFDDHHVTVVFCQ